MDAYWFTFVFADRSAKPTDHGPMNLNFVGRRSDGRIERNIRIPAGKTVIRQTRRDIRGSWYPFWTLSLAPAKEGADAMISGLTVHRDAPNIAHAPVRRVKANAPCTISATITMPPRPVEKSDSLSAAPGERLAAATLHFRSGDGPFEATALTADDKFVYSATLPAEKLAGKQLEYYFSAIDANGRSTTLPAEADAAPFRARISSDDAPPRIVHQPIAACRAGKPLKIAAQIDDPDGVAAVRVYYRPMNQMLPYERIVMHREGSQFVADIPAQAIRPDWDLVYYIEAVDQSGDGCFFPEWKNTAPYVIVRTESTKP
jgi:hypothetical protein